MIEIGPVSNERMTYDLAKLYILFYEHNGHKDWRLPTLQEWITRKDVYGWDEKGSLSSLQARKEPLSDEDRQIRRYVTPVRDIK